jgi:hypothetical protein
MKNKFFYHSLVSLLLIACFYSKANAQNIQADAKLEQSTIRIGDQTFLNLSVRQPAKAKVAFPQFADTIVSKVQVVRVGKADTIIDKTNPNIITINKSYTITSFDAGAYTLPSFSFTLPNGVIKTDPITLQVATVKVDTTKGVYDVKKPIVVSYTVLDELRDDSGWIALAIAVLLAAGGLFWYLKTRPVKEKPVVKITAPIVPAHQIAISKLKALKDKKLWQQDEVKEYYIELSEILREYLEKRYEIKTHEKTTDEIFAGLRHIDIRSDSKNTLRSILELSDLVKFAKAKPIPSENELSLENALVFVMQTQQINQPVNPEGGQTHV